MRNGSSNPKAAAFSGDASARPSSLAIPISSRRRSFTSRTSATYSFLPAFGFIFATALPICLSQAQYIIISVRRVLDLLVPSENALSACMSADSTWSFPHTMSGSMSTHSPPRETKCWIISSNEASPLIPATSASMAPRRPSALIT